MTSYRWMTGAALLAACCLLTPAQAQEEGDAPPPADGAQPAQPAQPGQPEGGREGRRGRFNRERGEGAGGGDMDRQARMQALRERFAGGMGGMRGGNRGTEYLERMIERAVGGESPLTLDSLNYGAEARMVKNVPVGGVENFSAFRDGWEVESIFTLDDEQTKKLGAVREAYKAELAKIQAKLDEANKALALQVAELRKQYEQKANDLLSAEAKAEKEKLDAVAAEYYAEKDKAVADTTGQSKDMLKQYQEVSARREANPEDAEARTAISDLFQKARTFSQEQATKTQELTTQYATKMKEAASGETKTKLTSEFDKLNNRRGAFGRDRDRERDRGARRPAGNGEGKTDKPKDAKDANDAAQPMEAPAGEF